MTNPVEPHTLPGVHPHFGGMVRIARLEGGEVMEERLYPVQTPDECLITSDNPTVIETFVAKYKERLTGHLEGRWE